MVTEKPSVWRSTRPGKASHQPRVYLVYAVYVFSAATRLLPQGRACVACSSDSSGSAEQIHYVHQIHSCDRRTRRPVGSNGKLQQRLLSTLLCGTYPPGLTVERSVGRNWATAVAVLYSPPHRTALRPRCRLFVQETRESMVPTGRSGAAACWNTGGRMKTPQALSPSSRPPRQPFMASCWFR